MVVKVTELVRDHISIRQEAERLLAEAILHLGNVDGKFVFASDFLRLGEVVYLLVLIQALVEIIFAAAAGPEKVPLVGFGVLEVVRFQD